MIILLWIALYSIWFWLIKYELETILRENTTVALSTAGITSAADASGTVLGKKSLLSPKAVEYVIGVIGILGFFLIGYLLA